MRTWALLALVLLSPPASGGELVYQPVNPAFGGNPFNGDFLLGTASAQDEHERNRRSTARAQLTPQERFLSTLQSRLLSAVAGQVSDAIFGDEARDEGTFRFDDQVISFVRGLETIDITIRNELTGEETRISVPTIEVGS